MSDVVGRAKEALEGITTGPWTYDGKRSIDGPGLAEVICPETDSSDDWSATWLDGINLKNDVAFITAARSLVPELVAELEQWRQMAEDSLGVDTPDEVAEYVRLSGLSINLGPYGEWGQETLQALFRDLDPALVDRTLGRVQP